MTASEVRVVDRAIWSQRDPSRTCVRRGQCVFANLHRARVDTRELVRAELDFGIGLIPLRVDRPDELHMPGQVVSLRESLCDPK